MGYSLHIHRKKNWFDDEPNKEISYVEWQAIAQNDNELTVVGIGSDLRVDFEIQSFGWPSPLGEKASFHWFPTGIIEMESTSEDAIMKANELAEKLEAKLQGDDGEFYRANGTHYHEDIVDDEVLKVTEKSRSFFSRLFKK